MGWSLGFDTKWNRDIGYGVPAYCDYPGCTEEIDRGLGYVCCSSQPYGGDNGCGRFYCGKHELWDFDEETDEQVCGHPNDHHVSPDHPGWMRWKLTDESWMRWRMENPDDVRALIDVLGREGSGE
jgi:hypothetical protein